MTDFFIYLCCGVILLFIFSPYLEHVGPKTSLTTLYSNSTQTRWCLICCSIRASYDWLAQMTSCQVVINYSCTKFAFAQNFLESRAKIQTDLKPNVAFNSSRISETQPVAKKGRNREKGKPLLEQVEHAMRNYLRLDEIRFGQLHGFDIFLQFKLKLANCFYLQETNPFLNLFLQLLKLVLALSLSTEAEYYKQTLTSKILSLVIWSILMSLLKLVIFCGNETPRHISELIII